MVLGIWITACFLGLVLQVEGDKYSVPLEESLVNKFITLASKDMACIYLDKVCCCLFFLN